jgi:hypothetical protein
MKVRRIVVDLDWRSRQPAVLGPVARLAGEMQAELIGLFIEEIELLQLAALPFAREVGFPSAVRRDLDVVRMERMLQTMGNDLRRTFEAVLKDTPVAWSFRITRGSRMEQLVTIAIERAEPTLLLPPGSDIRAEPIVVSLSEFSRGGVRVLPAGNRRPVLIQP